MKRVFIKILPLCALATSLFSCNSKRDVTVTIDAGLGYFTSDISDYTVPRSTSITLTVKSGTVFADLPISTPLADSDEIEIVVEKEGVGASPIYYTNDKNEVIPSNYSINDDVTIIANYYTDFTSAKSVAFGVYIQGLVGSVKRCVLNNKPTDHLFALSAIFDDYYSRLQSVYPCFALGKVGSALCDACGETGDERFIPLYETMYRQIYNVDNQVAFATGAGYQGIVGAIKQIIANNRHYEQTWWEQFVVDSTNAMKVAGPNKAMYLSKCIASLASQIGETQYEKKVIQDNVNAFIFNAFKSAHNAEQACSLYGTTNAFIGEFKRSIVNHKTDEELLTLFNSYKLEAIAILNG